MRVPQLIGAVFLIFASPAVAKDVSPVWLVSQESGDVRVMRPGMQQASLQLHGRLLPGDVVTTGTNGRAMLTRGDDYIVVSPGSQLLLPKDEQQSGFTRLVQQLGTMLYKVHHTGIPHFAVQTPMLAAVVKGTSFTVIVEQDHAAVQVTDGIVEVTSAAGQARRLVERGMTVYVGKERPDEIIQLKPGSAIPTNSRTAHPGGVTVARSGDVPLATIASLTGGMVTAAPSSAPGSSKGESPKDTPPATSNEASQATVAVATSATSIQMIEANAVGVSNGGTNLPGKSPPAASAPVIDAVTTTAPAATAPIVNTVTSTAPAVTAPVVNTVTTTVPAVIAPIINTVTSTAPTVTAPIVNTVTAVTSPIVNTVTAVTAPVVNAVTSTVPAMTAPIINTVTSTAPTVTASIVNTVTAVTTPIVNTVTAVTAPVVNTVTSTVPAVTQPVGSVLGTVGSLLGGH